MKVPVIYQDHYLLIVNKPAGLVVHPTYKHTDGTMWDAILEFLKKQDGDDWQLPEIPDEPKWSAAPEQVQIMLRKQRRERMLKEEGLLPKPCLLHRLDKNTSGVVALARTERSRRHLVRQFHEHRIVKRYIAVVQKGAPEWARPRAPFTIIKQQNEKNAVLFELMKDDVLEVGQLLLLEGALQRDPKDRRRCIVGPEGLNAQTMLRVLASNGEYLLVEAQPVTGRTHQIRAHLAALGYAIIGDSIYSLPSEEGVPTATMKRQFLHAFSLEFRRYPDNQLCSFVAPLADDLEKWLEDYFPIGLDVMYESKTISA